MIEVVAQVEDYVVLRLLQTAWTRSGVMECMFFTIFTHEVIERNAILDDIRQKVPYTNLHKAQFLQIDLEQRVPLEFFDPFQRQVT